MQSFRFSVAQLPFWALAFLSILYGDVLAAAPAKIHVVNLGSTRKVPWIPPGTTPLKGHGVEIPSIRVRPLMVDGRQKEWTTGDSHDVTDRSFTIRRALRLNDTLPGESAIHWSWQPGPWLMVDRSTGHITALHLPDFDDVVSEAVWYRDYAAYCGTATTAKGGLFAVVAQIGARRAVVQRQIGKWPQTDAPEPVCKSAAWQREPMRVTMQATGGDAMTFDVVGTASLIEEGDSPDAPQ